jgi:hypothetical protein
MSLLVTVPVRMSARSYHIDASVMHDVKQPDCVNPTDRAAWREKVTYNERA